MAWRGESAGNGHSIGLQNTNMRQLGTLIKALSMARRVWRGMAGNCEGNGKRQAQVKNTRWVSTALPNPDRFVVRSGKYSYPVRGDRVDLQWAPIRTQQSAKSTAISACRAL